MRTFECTQFPTPLPVRYIPIRPVLWLSRLSFVFANHDGYLASVQYYFARFIGSGHMFISHLFVSSVAQKCAFSRSFIGFIHVLRMSQSPPVRAPNLRCTGQHKLFRSWNVISRRNPRHIFEGWIRQGQFLNRFHSLGHYS